jgi:hypothetical protein
MRVIAKEFAKKYSTFLKAALLCPEIATQVNKKRRPTRDDFYVL